MIRIESLTKRFGRTPAVDGVSLDVPRGRSLALWGANGAGKTTIIRCVLGLLSYDGRIEVGGFDVRRRGKRARRLIGYVPQELGFNDDLRLAEAVGFFARLKGVDPGAVDQVLGDVGLCGHESKRMRELSGGMKQRLALAGALLGDPPVLVLDEVTASLDVCGRDEFVALLAGLGKKGKSMLFASHRVEEVTALADRVAMLERGRLVEEVPPHLLSERLGRDSWLHLRMEPQARGRAVAVLREQGFDARLNGGGVLVAVSPPAKGAPMRVLAEERIPIDDFELRGGRLPEEAHS
jgi:ABC-type multidrug transport system ATPase subunit